jgi:methyl-accepting chemotaxis protein
MSFANFNIGVRLGAGLAVILVLLAAMGGVGVWSLHSSGAAFDRQSALLDRARMGEELSGLISASSTGVNASLRVSDPEVQAFFMGAASKQAERGQEILKQLNQDAANSRGRGFLDDIEKLAAQFRSVRDEAIGIKKRDNPDDAALLATMLREKFRPASVAYIEAVDKYRDAALNAAEEASQAAVEAASSARTLLMSCGIAAIVLGVVIGYLLTRSITRPIAYAVRVAGVIASGDLTQRIDVSSKDETGQMLGALRDMNDRLAKTVGQIRTEAESMKDDAQRIAESVDEVSKAASHQSDATASMAAAIEELTVSVGHISDAANDTQRNSEGVAEKCMGGETQVASAADSMTRIAKAVSEAAQKIRSLESRAAQINSVAAAIKEIANQTNLLALNAAIEAARAGDQGRGFSVVADEVRQLAERTASATVEIEEMVSAVQRETAESTSQMEYVLPLVQDGSEQAGQVAEALRDISNSARASLERVREVAHATREQTSASTSIAQQVESIAQMVEETTAAMGSTAKSAVEMREMAGRLSSLVGSFRV